METTVALDENTQRKFFLDQPEDQSGDMIFILNLHGGGSHGTWQHKYFPAHDYRDACKLIVATPSAATKEPMRRWVEEADDEHLKNIVEYVYRTFGKDKIKAFWLAGHSQGGMTSQRLLNTEYFADRVDGWLSLSGGRMGPTPRSENAGRPSPPGTQPRPRPQLTRPSVPDCDFSFIFAVGEHEIDSLPMESPWAEKYGADARVELPDVVDTEPGQIYDTTCDGYQTKEWGRNPAPGKAKMFVFPNARDGRVIADVVRLDKGHTEGLEPKVTEEIVKLMVQEPGGKMGRL
jgi:pimeloyl-ACP methyl ester carboxylesterase